MFEDKKNKIFQSYVDGTFKMIEVKPGKCRYNFRCHLNSVHEAMKHNHDKIAMVVYFVKGNDPIVHFINYNGKKFVDNTLGQWTTFNEYHFVRWISKDEFSRVNTIFTNFCKTIHNMMPWYIRWTHKPEY